MECPKCHLENPIGSKFCGGCGQGFDLACSVCGTNNPVGNKYCIECGINLKSAKEDPDRSAETKNQSAFPSIETAATDTSPITGERKHVTVLFSDITGYTTMSEKLDPEEVKEITSRILSDISKIVGKYDGFIEKYAGDAVMAIFGVPRAHEDDPIRAARVARDIHELVESISPEIEPRIGQPISMHSGINTGLVVTGEVDLERGTHGIAGDTINVAARLSSLAEAGQILVDENTFRQVEGHFIFEHLKPVNVKGKSEAVRVHKLLTQREKPVTVRRLSGLRAELVGRKVELTDLCEAVEDLRVGRGRIFSLCGNAGTGKSRLIEEFKSTLDLNEIQWLEGHAFAYSQNIPYFPLIDLLNGIFHIEENDSHAKIREKIESGIEDLIGKIDGVVPYIGGLYSLSYTEIEKVSPEFWKSRLQEAILVILTALAKRSPTVFFLEDLHWADSSFTELLRNACIEIRQPAILLCAYRPSFHLFISNEACGIGKLYHEIKLENLSFSNSQVMMQSLLNTKSIPSDLKNYIQHQTEGNPFYLEELVNSLIESETLVQDNGHWRITQSLMESDISPSIHALIASRLDRLEMKTKRLLQEASVIGRVFLYDILKKITVLKDSIDIELNILVQLDLIRTRAVQPDLEYMFKHAVTQEVVYKGLLKKERREIHEQIARVMEGLFHDRLPEFYETLAIHFKQGNSTLKAVDYLIKSGDKSVRKYAVEESHQYYKEAFDLLSEKPKLLEQNKDLMIELLIKWAYVFYYRGDFNGLISLFSAHEDIASSLDDKAREGMFNGWLGFGHYMAGSVSTSDKYLRKALRVGEEAGDQQVIAYACTWLVWSCVELGLPDKAISFGERAHEIAKKIEHDHYLNFKPLAGIASVYWAMGDWKEAIRVGETIVDYGQKHSNIRSISMGYTAIGQGYLAAGDLSSAADSCQKAIKVAEDPVYGLWAKCWLWQTQLLSGHIKEATDILQEIVTFSDSYGYGAIGLPAYAGMGLTTVMNGQMNLGVRMLKDSINLSIESERKSFQAVFEHLLGKVYLQLVENKEPVSLSMIAKNIGFLLKSIPFAHKKAEVQFNKTIEIAEESGAKNLLAQAYLDLGLLHKAKKKTDKAKKCITEAIKIFKECEAEILYLQAKEALEN